MGSAATRREDRRTGSRATAWRGSAQAETPVGGRSSFSVPVGIVAVRLPIPGVGGAGTGLRLFLALAVQLLALPEDISNGLLAKSGLLDCSINVDIELDVPLVARELRASQMTAGAEAEGRREKPLDLPQGQRDEELLLLLREAERGLALLAPK